VVQVEIPHPDDGACPPPPEPGSGCARPGDLLHLDGFASVQFAGVRAITAEVVRVLCRPLFDDWLWLEVVVRHPPVPEAEAHREVFVQRRAVPPAQPRPVDAGY
jgi:hypothetical protein